MTGASADSVEGPPPAGRRSCAGWGCDSTSAGDWSPAAGWSAGNHAHFQSPLAPLLPPLWWLLRWWWWLSVVVLSLAELLLPLSPLWPSPWMPLVAMDRTGTAYVPEQRTTAAEVSGRPTRLWPEA